MSMQYTMTTHTVDALTDKQRAELLEITPADSPEPEARNCAEFLLPHAQQSRLAVVGRDGDARVLAAGHHYGQIDRVIGWAVLAWDVRRATIGVYVAADMRRRHVGTQLAVQVLRVAEALDLDLRHGHRLSDGAAMFYKTLGVKPPE